MVYLFFLINLLTSTVKLTIIIIINRKQKEVNVNYSFKIFL